MKWVFNGDRTEYANKRLLEPGREPLVHQVQTAVEWLYEELWKQTDFSLPNNLLEQAKEMGNRRWNYIRRRIR